MSEPTRKSEPDADVAAPVESHVVANAGPTVAGAELLAQVARARMAPGDRAARLVRLSAAQRAAALRGLGQGVGNRAVARTLTRGAPRTVARLVDPAVGSALDQIHNLPMVLNLEGRIDRTVEAMKGIDLVNPDNARAFLAEIERDFAPDERVSVISAVMSAADTLRHVPTPEEEAEMRRKSGLMQVQPRGPWGQVGPGVLLPELSNVARPLLPLVEAVDAGLAGAGAFVNGLIDGASAAVTAADRDRLRSQLVASTLLNAIFPPVFLTGAVVGIAEDVVDAVKGIWNLITDFGGFLDQMKAFLSAFFGADSRESGTRLARPSGASTESASRT